MTKQNVVVPEDAAVSAATMTAAAAAAASASPSFSGNDKKLATLLEVSASRGRISAWMDLMRAVSAPAAPAPAPVAIPSDNDEEHGAWMKQHPCALDMFDEIAAASKGKQIVMFLDYDGTLSPIVADPDRAFMSDAMRSTVGDLARYFPTAIVSGRARAKVYNFVRLAQLYYAGSHGMDIKGPTKGSKHTEAQAKTVLFQPANEFLPMINEVYKALLERTKSTPGSKVENNKFCVSVHFRCVDEKRWRTLADQVKSVLQDYPKLQLTQGRKVLEIRPNIKWDKGRALEFLLETLGFGDCSDVLPIYIGDDRTDEDAFKVLRDRGQGFGILVSEIPKETSASYSLQDPTEVMEFLHCLVEWKRLSLKTRQRV